MENQIQEFKCVDPYGTDPNLPAPRNPDEAHQAWANAKQASSKESSEKTEVRRIIAERSDISSGEFNFRADLTPILREHGPGIYGILLWRRPLNMSENTPLSEQSIFWQTEPPEDNPYRGYWTPAPKEAKQAKRLPTTSAPPVNIFQEPTPVTLKESTPDPSIPVFLAATPIPLPDLSPKPTPNIHARTVQQYSYSMEFPPGWMPARESDGRTTFLSPRGTAGATVRIWKINSDDAADLFKEHLEELLKRMRTTVEKGDSGVFEMKPPRPLPAAVKEHLWQARQMEYRWRESPDQCIRDVVDIISPSNWYTHSVLIIAWTCEKNLDGRAETERQKILTSFREKNVR